MIGCQKWTLGAAQRVDSDRHPRPANRLHVDDVREVGDICADVVVAVDVRRFAGAVIGNSAHAVEVLLEQCVGGALDPCRRNGIGRAAIRRVVLEAAVLGRIVRGGDDDPVGKTALARLVVGQDRVRNDGRRRVPAARVDHHVNIVGGEYLQRACQRGRGKRVRVDADEQRSGNGAAPPVIADRLADRQDMRLVEGVVEGRSAMTRRAEGNALRRHRRVRLAGEIGRHQLRTLTSIDGSTVLPARGLTLSGMAFLAARATRQSSEDDQYAMGRAVIRQRDPGLIPGQRHAVKRRLDDAAADAAGVLHPDVVAGGMVSE